MRQGKGRYRFLFTTGLAALLALTTAVTAFPGQAQAANFGGLTDNGTAAYMGIGASPHAIRPLYVFGNVPLFERAQDSAGFIIQRTNSNRWVLGVNESASLGNGFVLSTYPVGDTSSTPRLLVTPTGNVGIGTTSPNTLTKLHVVNDNSTTHARAIYGITSAGQTTGVYGETTSTSNSSYGVYGINRSNYGWIGGYYDGVRGVSTNDYGVRGSSSNYYGVYGSSDNGTGVFGSGTVNGVSGSSSSGIAVYGTSTSNNGVFGSSTLSEGVRGSNGAGNYGYLGDNNSGVYGKNTGGHWGALGQAAAGVEGQDPSGTMIGRLGTATEGVYGQAPFAPTPLAAPWAGNFNGNVLISGALNVMVPPIPGLPVPNGMVSFFLPGTGPAAAPGSFIVFPPNPMLTPDPIVLNDNTTVYGTFTVIGGPKLFSLPDPADPSKSINYACIEGPEAGNYIRGSAEIVSGKAVIDLPEHFAKVTSDKGLTVQLTPVGKWLQLYVAEQGTSRIIIAEATGQSGTCSYLVQGVRKGYEDFQVMRDRATAPNK